MTNLLSSTNVKYSFSFFVYKSAIFMKSPPSSECSLLNHSGLSKLLTICIHKN